MNLHGPPPGLGMPDLFASMRRRELLQGEELDSCDEEIELLRCEKDLVEAAVELGTTTSADEDFLATDNDFEDDEDGLTSLPLPATKSYRPSVSSVVIEEDDEEGSENEEGGDFDDDSSKIRSRLWAQSLLRLRRSIEEIFLLCEFESDESLCEQVEAILSTAGKDFSSLLQQLQSQQEYSLLGYDHPLKGVAWTTRTPRTSKGMESMFEQLEKAQLGSPSRSSTCGSKEKPTSAARKRPVSAEPVREDMAEDADVAGADFLQSEDRWESQEVSGPKKPRSRSHELHDMVQSTLDSVHQRLGGEASKSPEEIQEKHETRQRRAQVRRAIQDDQRAMKLHQAESRALAARKRRQEQEGKRQQDLLDKMSRARRQYQEQLRIVCQRARKENTKTAEVNYIAREAIKSEDAMLNQKLENARVSRKTMREQMRKKLIESAKRVAKVSENRRRQLEMWQEKVQQDLEEKERLAAERRREHMNSIKLKSQGQETRSEIVQKKRQQLQEVDERSSQDFLRFRNKTAGRLAMDFDGLSEAVREEVAEQNPSSRTAAPKSRRKVSAAASTRATTPPPHTTASPQSWPPRGGGAAAGAELSDSAELQLDEVQQLPPLPSFPEVPRMPGAAALGSGAPLEEEAQQTDAASLPTSQEAKPKFRKGSTASTSSPRNGVAGVGKTAAKSVARGASATDPKGPSRGGQNGDSPVTSTGATSDAATGGEAAADLVDVAKDSANAKAASECLEQLRKQLDSAALGDEEALRIACESDGSKAAASNAAQRAKISKLAIDLGKVAGMLNPSGGPSTSSEDLQQPASSLNLERAEAVLADFCKVLGQAQREADYALVLKLNCGRMAVDLCCRVKDSIAGLVALGEKAPVAAWKQNCNVMISALKFLGLLCKQRLARIFLLLTSRVLVLADITIACLDMHLSESQKTTDAQGGPALFLPQLLHILALHTKQTLPDSIGDQGHLSDYLLLCGLGEKLKHLFGRADIRLKIFDGASPLPLLLLRAMGFLGTLVGTYRLPASPTSKALQVHKVVLDMLQSTDLFGIVSVLVTILLSEGRREKGAKLPQTVISLCVQAVRILNTVARIDLHTLQKTLATTADRQQELYHLLVALLDYCSARAPASVTKPTQAVTPGQAEENDLLVETIVFLGFYCLQEPKNQSIVCYGEGQALLTRLTSLPLHYFMDERGRAILFPTILATCFKSEHNLDILRSEMNLTLLVSFLTSLISQQAEGKQLDAVQPGISMRFPPVLWQEALEFLDGCVSQDGEAVIEASGSSEAEKGTEDATDGGLVTDS